MILKRRLHRSAKRAAKESHSYAVVPYEGPNGTFRRPIYIECIKNELVLQPEGVRLTADDLRPPIGPGNPLASVLRAGREHIVRLNPKVGQSRDTEPYPLLLVRPDGLVVYDRARQAIEAGDFELGFELVESDWKLKYPEPDPQLAATEQQALDQARARQEVLAAAAPRAYRNASLSADCEFDFEDEGDGGGVSGGSGSARGGPGAGPGAGGGTRATSSAATGMAAARNRAVMKAAMVPPEEGRRAMEIAARWQDPVRAVQIRAVERATMAATATMR